MDPTNPLLLFALAVFTLFCIRLLMSKDSRGRARYNLVTLARRRPRPSVQALVAVLLWLASIAFAVDLVAHIAIQAPEALTVVYKFSTLGAIITTTAAALIWTFSARSAAFLPPDGDLRLAAEAKRLGVSTEEAVMRTLDAGLPKLNPKGD